MKQRGHEGARTGIGTLKDEVGTKRNSPVPRRSRHAPCIGRRPEVPSHGRGGETTRDVADGLTQVEAAKRLGQYGPNEIEEKKTNPFLKLLGYFWGPSPG